MNILGIIPARYASSRFPGKVLADIAGKSMLQRVYEQCIKTAGFAEIIIATEDERVAQHAEGFGAKVVLTSPAHPSGTDRCREALEKTAGHFDFVVNIQGDEPFIRPEQIGDLISCLQPDTELATLVKKIDDLETLLHPGACKVVFNHRHEALYFSRSPIPYINKAAQKDWLKVFDYYEHVGVYAYRTDILHQITQLPASSLETAESLEQLRWLENGFKVKINFTQYESVCIDTPEDLEKVLKEGKYV